MLKYTFEEIKEDVYEWSQKAALKYIAQHDKIELTQKNDDVLLFDMTFNNCLAQLTVSNPVYAPYQFISFEAMTLDSEKAQKTGEPELVYFFYDSSEMRKREVINELKIGIQYCSRYVPNQLSEIYINRSGIITMKYEDARHIVHPDDIKKISTGSLSGKFTCKGIEAQYLVVERDKLSLRILPKAFI